MSPAERMRERRKRQRAAASDAGGRTSEAPRREPDEIDAQVAKGVAEARAINRLLPEQHPPLSEDEYVRLSVPAAVTHRGRAERYARWRYRGYCAGIVASLV